MPAATSIESLRSQVSRAVELNQRGRSAHAARRFATLRDRILARQDHDADVLVQLSRVLLGLSASRLDVSGDVGASMLLLAEAEDAADRAGAKHLQAAIRGQRGLLFLRLGSIDQALASLDGAAELLAQAEPYDQMTILLNRGALHLDRGDLEQAYADLDRCADIAEQDGDSRLEVMARHNLGYVDFLAGNIPRAIATMNQAADAEDGPPHPIGMLDRARVLREAGLLTDADALLAEASERLRAQRMFQDLAETELVRAECALASGDPVTALRFASSARRRFVKRGNLRWQRRAELAGLRAEWAAADRVGAVARRRLRRLAERSAELGALCGKEGRTDLARQAVLLEAQCRLAAGDPAPGPVPESRRDDPLGTRLVVHEVRARAAHALGDRVATVREIRSGFAELGSYQGGLGSLDLRTASAVHGLSLGRLDLDLALGTGRPGEVLAAVERSRSVSSRLAGVRPAADEETARLLAELRALEEEMRGLEGDPQAHDHLTRLGSRAVAVQRQVRRRGWQHEAHRGPERTGRVASMSAVRTAVREEGGCFVSYAAHEGRWLAVVVGRGGARLVEVGPVDQVAELVRRTRADLDALAMPHLPGQIRQAVAVSLEECLSRLDQTLIAPLGVDRVPMTISAGGALVVLPWSLLPSRRGLPVVVTPSASFWLRGRQPAPRSQVTRAVAVAGPGLRRSEDEAAAVGEVWAGSSVLAGDGAGTAAVREALVTADVVHVAAHGLHQQESPLFSSLRLADGPLYAYELDVAARAASCVVLSACEAGLSTVRPGDEGLGLTHALLHLGSKSVLAGVARVRDDVAAELMTRVHQSMARGTDSASALAQAQADCSGLLETGAPAPFMCFGATWRT